MLPLRRGPAAAAAPARLPLLPPAPRCRRLAPAAAACGSRCSSSSRVRVPQLRRCPGPRRQRLAPRAAVEAWPSLQRRSRSRYVNKLNRLHGMDSFVEFYQSSQSGQPVAYIMHPRGDTLEVHLQGATITRWLKPDGTDLLHLRSDAAMEPGEAINSGIPIAFPQWRDGPLPFNGFADKLEWEVCHTAFDGTFTNTLVSAHDLATGRVQLAVDEDGCATAPRPGGVYDEDDLRGGGDGADAEAAEDALAADLDALAAQQQLGLTEPAATKAAAKAAKARAKRKAVKAAASGGADDAAAAEAAAADADVAEAAAVAAALGGGRLQQQPADEAEGEAEAEASSEEDGEEGSEGEDDEDEDIGLDYGLLEDPAPCIVLRLSDSEETRAVWPHRFELYYKITLMETDDFPDPREGLPRGVHPFFGADLPASAEAAALAEMLHGDDEEASRYAADVLAERFRASNLPSGRGLEPDGFGSAREVELDWPRQGQLSYTGQRVFTDEDGPVWDEEAPFLPELLEGGPEQPQQQLSASGRPLRGAAAASAARKQAAAAAEAADDEARAEEDDEQEEEEEGEDEGLQVEELDEAEVAPGQYRPEELPMQLRLQWILVNKDPEGSPPMAFQLAALPHFATKDQMRFGEFVRILGLGGVTTFDWSDDPRRKRLVGNTDDYVSFEGLRRDTVYINSHDADVKFCPGSRTHFDLMARKGLTDHVVWHPGAMGLPGLEVEPRYFTQVGAGKVATSKKLAPGETWSAEFVVRHHERYWDPPIFDRDSAQPMPSLMPQRDDADDREELDDGVVEGIGHSRLGGGPNVPWNDE